MSEKWGGGEEKGRDLQKFITEQPLFDRVDNR